APPDPPARSLAGAPRPAPFAWLTRCARSLVTVAARGALPRRTPLHAHSRGPHAPLRSRGSLAALVRWSLLQPGGLCPAGPSCTLTRGGPTPRSVRVAHSLRSFAGHCCSPGGFAPPDPPARSLAGAPRPPPFAWLTRCTRSLVTVAARGALPRRPPLHAHSRGPHAPLRSRGSLAALVRWSLLQPGGLCPAGPPCTLTRGGPTPRSVRVAHSLRSFAGHCCSPG